MRSQRKSRKVWIMRTLVIAGAVLLALAVAPLGDLSPVSTAAAYVCPVSDDPVRDVQCRLNQCGAFDPKRPLEYLKPRMCPD